MTGYESKKKAAQDKLAQPEQEPVGRFAKFTDGIWREVTDGSAGQPLYTAPQQRKWVGLTDDEKSELWEISRAAWPRYVTYASLAEAKLKEKNNG